jgi:hypothetical protein
VCMKLAGVSELRPVLLGVAAALAPVDLAQEVGQTQRPVVVELRGGVVVVDPGGPGLAVNRVVFGVLGPAAKGALRGVGVAGAVLVVPGLHAHHAGDRLYVSKIAKVNTLKHIIITNPDPGCQVLKVHAGAWKQQNHTSLEHRSIITYWFSYILRSNLSCGSTTPCRS